ncbi:MAG: hypothetical protein JXQ76_04430 [Campylobacterales bacterium]|nr:hypothetical protein [Campylobacterales bacterium]
MTDNNRNTKNESIFNEREIDIAVRMQKELAPTVDVLSYMLDKTQTKFTIIIIKADYEELYQYIVNTKRESDILKIIDQKYNIFGIVCQDTAVDGGYMFANRMLTALIKEKKIKDVSCIALEVRTNRYDVRDIIYKAFQLYITSRRHSSLGEIKYHSL